MVSSVLVLEPDTDIKFDRAVYGRFFTNFAVRKIAFLGKDLFAKTADAPLCELLLISYQAVNTPERKAAIGALERIYEEQRLPIIHASNKDVASISEEFLTMAFGDSLTLLKDKNVVKRQKALYVLARFFAEGAFARSAYVEKLKQLCKDFPDAQIGGLIQNFASKGYIQTVERGRYRFVGLDQRTFSKLQSAGFDMDQSMQVPKLKPQDEAVTKTSSQSPTPAPTALKATAPVSSEFDELVRREFAQLRLDLAKQVEEHVQKALVSQKINDRLLSLSPKALEKAEALLELLASP